MGDVIVKLVEGCSVGFVRLEEFVCARGSNGLNRKRVPDAIALKTKHTKVEVTEVGVTGSRRRSQCGDRRRHLGTIVPWNVSHNIVVC